MQINTKILSITNLLKTQAQKRTTVSRSEAIDEERGGKIDKQTIRLLDKSVERIIQENV